jgi:hypothetical protein
MAQSRPVRLTKSSPSRARTIVPDDALYRTQADHTDSPVQLSPKTQIAIGLAINIPSWIMAWFGPAPFRYHTFFPLWLGFIIAVDGLTRLISGTSLLQRLGWRSIALFLVSIPIWWIFEGANDRLGNWVYTLPRHYPWLEYRAEASLAFSTVAPAIFVMSELVRATIVTGRIRWIRITPGRRGLLTISAAGGALFVATLIWPGVLFPFVWISLFLAVDPLVQVLGGRSISGAVARGRWDPVIVLFIGTLICGFFWEFWNFWSMPKWTYQIEYADWFRLFEMPVLGYGGYLPFALEVFAFVALADRLIGLGIMSTIRFDRANVE